MRRSFGSSVSGVLPPPPGSFLVPQGGLTTLLLVDGTTYLVPMPDLVPGITVAKIGCGISVGSTAAGPGVMRFGLWQENASDPAAFDLLSDFGTQPSTTAADTEAAMMTLASPYTIPGGVRRVYAALGAQGAPATQATVRSLSTTGCVNVRAGYPITSMRPGVSRAGIAGAFPSSQAGWSLIAAGPWIIVKTGGP